MPVNFSNNVTIDPSSPNEIVESTIENPKATICVLPNSTRTVEHGTDHVENGLAVNEVFQQKSASGQHPHQNLEKLSSLRKVPGDSIAIINVRRQEWPTRTEESSDGMISDKLFMGFVETDSGIKNERAIDHSPCQARVAEKKGP
jgi:hypothetical protein